MLVPHTHMVEPVFGGNKRHPILVPPPHTRAHTHIHTHTHTHITEPVLGRKRYILYWCPTTWNLGVNSKLNKSIDYGDPLRMICF
jgi:hypothetical protein